MEGLLLAAVSTWLKPLWMVIAGGLAVAGGIWAIGVLLDLVLPKPVTIARATAKEAFAQPLFYVLLAIGTALIVLFTYLPYNTFGEDIKVLKDQGFTLIMILALILALWTASVSVAEEIEGRTALTLLSKPVNRREFILGKFLGILIPVAILFLVLGAVFLASVSYKVVYDAREMAKVDPGWNECRLEILQTVPGLVLAFFETVVLTAISVAVSTRLPMLPNLVICATIYVLGNLVQSLANSSLGQFEMVRFAAQLFATVLPVLENYNIQAAVSTGREVPLSYLLVAAGYCALYSTVAMLMALLLFEDRDLA